MSGKKPEFNFNPSNFKFDFGAPPPGGDSSDEDNSSSGRPKGGPAGGALSAEMMAALQERLSSMIGAGSDLYATLPEAVKRRINALEGLQNKYEDLNNEFEKELYELEKKYEGLYKPLYARRAEIVSGKVEPTEEEVAAGAREEDETGPKIEEVKEEGAEEKKEEEVMVGVPNFWLGALQAFDQELLSIEEDDEPALEKLIDITCESFDQRFEEKPKKDDESDDEFAEQFSGFKLTFHFAPNDYFTNTTLSKTFYMIVDEEDELNFDHSEADKIDWKPGKNLTVRSVQKQVGGNRGGKRGRGGRGGRGGGGGGAPKTIIVEEPTNSFFNFFCSQTNDHDDEEEERDEDEDGEMNKAEQYYAIGESIRHQVIPRAVLWYLGEGRGPSDEELEAMANMGGDSDEDGDFDPNAAGQQAPECKQQ